MASQPSIGVIIAAAGAGERLGRDLPKQWRLLAGVNLVQRACRSFLPSSLTARGQRCSPAQIVVVVDDESRMAPASEWESLTIHTVRGGATRTVSVRNGLTALPADLDLIAVHDAARPFWPLTRWDLLVQEALHAGGAILAVPLADTVKGSAGKRVVTVDRRGLWAAQTPQMYRSALLRDAHAQAERDGHSGTDDAELVERIGGDVAVVPSTHANLKITTPEDWELAERIMMTTEKSGQLRVGVGFDAHRLGADGPLRIGGVELAETGGLIGHSDGDVLLHAICDALLGAAALGDIGRHFPPDAAEFAGIDSRVLLRRTGEMLRRAGFNAHQIDAVVMAEKPRLAPHIEGMRSVIAGDLGLDTAMVSVKATTTETMGFVGRGEGIAAQAVAAVRQSERETVGESSE